MEEYSGKGKPCPRLLELMPSHRDWCGEGDKASRNHSISSEEKNLELRLGPPGIDGSLFSYGYYSSKTCTMNQNNGGQKFHVPSAANSVASNNSQKRAAPATLVGWPPVRSSRKNLNGNCFTKPVPQAQEAAQIKPSDEARIERGFFVKINMQGIPIGRKVNLNLYNSYEKLGAAVDELFRGLLAARKDSSGGGIMNMGEEEKPISDVLDGTGEYTLVYEDNDGDRVLVTDLPWQMFLSNVKRLLVLKSVDLFAPKRDCSGVRS